MPEVSPGRLWTPSEQRVQASRMTAYLEWLKAERGLAFTNYQELHQWSVSDIEGFWMSIWDYFGVTGHSPPESILSSRRIPGARWFAGASLNYAELALRANPANAAIISRSEGRADSTLTFGELRARVAAVAEGFRRLGLERGDRVAAYLPNVPEAVICLLATASLGAIWTSCPPEFGIGSVIDRFAQVQPKLLLAVDGYVFAGRRYQRLEQIAEIAAMLPTVRHTVVIPLLEDRQPLDGLRGSLDWRDIEVIGAPLRFEPVPFEHPLWILYSSGTTGLPKAIVHGHGGIVLEHLKSLALHRDLGPEDTFFWQTTPAWMMWNLLVGGLLVGSTIVLYDGSPGHPDLGTLWKIAAETRTTCFGASAAFIHSCLKADLKPGLDFNLTALKSVGSTGSPLSPEGFEWVYTAVGADLLLAPGSGGTDVCSAFVGPCPLLPVNAGEMQCRTLGASVESFDDQGRSLVGEVGELVVTAPMPSMPLFLWGDKSGERMRDSYFSTYPGVWRHGDWIRISESGACVILGRSDSTLNRSGVRMGTSEFYRVVEANPRVADSLVVDTGALGREGELLLFVVTTEGSPLDEAMVAELRESIRRQLSPRHLPDRILQLPSVPRTLTGKKMEVPVKRILSGVPPAEAASADAMQDPGALQAVVEIARRGS